MIPGRGSQGHTGVAPVSEPADQTSQVFPPVPKPEPGGAAETPHSRTLNSCDLIRHWNSQMIQVGFLSSRNSY